MGVFLISLGSLFARQPAPMLGLDISSSSVKLVELGRGRDTGLVLERCALEPLERGWVTDGNIEKFDEVAAAIKRLVKKSGARTKSVAMALPLSAVISKKIVLPAGLSDDELQVQVEAEAHQYIPFALDEVSLDFCVLGPSATSVGDVDVLIAASRKEKVQDREGLAEAAGLKPAVIDVESYASRLALTHWQAQVQGQQQDKVTAVFEIGAMNTSMQVLRNDDLLYERDQSFGGAQLTQLIVRHYGFSAAEAENKKRGGDLPNDYAQAVLAPFVEELTQEIERTLRFFFTSTPHSKVDGVLLAGGSAGLVGLPEAVTSQTGFACQVINPFEAMQLGPQVRENKLAQQAPSYLTACGLALRRFNP